jgi:DNA-binding transcriptional MerR regulator
MTTSTSDMTIDQLAAAVGMTVRNVRAYSSRGLIQPPRLVGRTGYYTEVHVKRLQLVRELLDRGYTLNAVEKALSENAAVPDSHALDLLTLLANPLGQAQVPEELPLEALGRLANIDVDRETGLLDRLEQLRLLERLDHDMVRLLQPVLVRAGAQALALGLTRDTVMDLLETVTGAVDQVAVPFVAAFRDEVWRPFRDAGMPEEDWPALLNAIQSLLPVASQVVVAAFRDRLATVIDSVLGEELAVLTRDQVGLMFPDQAQE